MLDYDVAGRSDAKVAPPGFLHSVRDDLDNISSILNRIAGRLYENGFPAGPSQTATAPGGPTEDNVRQRIDQRVRELFEVARAIETQVERLT